MKTQKELLQELKKTQSIARSLQINLDKAVEKAKYWEDKASQQNECIVSQSKRYEKLEQTIKENTQPIDTVVRITELEAVLQAERTRNKELDKMLENYEDNFSSMSYKIKSLEKDIKDLTNTCDSQTKDLKIAQANESLFLREIAKYSQARKDFKEKSRKHSREKRTCNPRPQKTKSLRDINPNPRGLCFDEMVTKEQQDRESYQEKEVFKAIKSIKITFDKIGNYMPKRG